MLRRILGGSLVVLVTACTSSPYEPPSSPSETGYTANGMPSILAVAGAESQHFAVGKEISGEWWTLFQSTALNEILDHAVAGNRNLASAKATLAAAHDAVAVAAGGLYPHIDFAASALRQRNNYQAVGFTGFPPKEFNVFSLGPSVSYTFSFAGLVPKEVERLEALEAVQKSEVEGAYLTLTGSVVTEAITIASIRAQIKAIEDIIADDQNTLQLVRNELTAGAGTEIDVQTATSQLAGDRTQLPPLRQQLNVAQHAMAVLLGRAPAAWTPPDFNLDSFVLPVELPVSLPTSLVHQRPDILGAEGQLHAASAAIGVANAQLYPNITLSANIGQQFLSPTAIFDEASNIWSFGVNVAAPIFHGGSLEAQKSAAMNTYEAVLASYQQTVLTSFAQVADLLDALAHDSEMLAAQQAASQSAEAALKLSRTSYQLGNTNLLQVLDTQRLAQQARLGLARAQSQRYLDSAQLFVAMGGGWWNHPPVQSDSPPPKS